MLEDAAGAAAASAAGGAGTPTLSSAGMPAYPQATIDALSSLQGANGISGEQQLRSGYVENYHSNLAVHLVQNQVRNMTAQAQAQTPAVASQAQQADASVSGGAAATSASAKQGSAIAPSNEKGGVSLPSHLQPQYSVTDLQLLMQELSETDSAAVTQADVQAVAEMRPLATYYTSIPLVAEVCKNRRFDTNRLREIRKQMDSPNFSTAEVDNLANEYMKDIVDLAADYIGNTAVQKFFERASEDCKYTMLEELAPHLAMIGIHKNGTWSAQKIIDCCRRPDQVELISKHLRPYVPPLMLDQFGNYVVQCVLPFGTPSSDFVFDAIVDRIWEIAQGRFGARSMRACLENSNHVSRRQVKRVASAIILHAVPLSTNPNGALLLTWLLDTSGLPARYRLLAPRFAPHLAQLCVHKLASLTIWRIVSQKTDMTASRLILDALFGKPAANEREEESAESNRAKSKELSPLEEILIDQAHGAAFVAKVLGSSAVESSKTDGRPDKPRYVEQVRKLLRRNRLVGVPGYRRVLEEVGLLDSLPPASVPASVSGPVPGVPSGPGVPQLPHGLPSVANFGMMGRVPPPSGGPAPMDVGLPPPPPSLLPPHLLSGGPAGNAPMLQELANLGFPPPSGPMHPSGAGGTGGGGPAHLAGLDPAELNAMMSSMQLNPQLFGPGGQPLPPLSGMPMGHVGGPRGQLGHGGIPPPPPPHGLGNGVHAHASPTHDGFSMSPEQAVGSGVLSPPPAPRMGWPVQPQSAPGQHHAQGSTYMASFNPWDASDIPNAVPFGRGPARSARNGGNGGGGGGNVGGGVARGPGSTFSGPAPRR
ncbi:hypothetical protein OC835_006591 [Tilletia horrida]|nr:hypothetical protein OC835_006591 [Tilletia horrida]